MSGESSGGSNVAVAFFMVTFYCSSATTRAQLADEALPAIAGAFVVGLLVGTEAGLLHAYERSAFCWSQGPDDGALQSHGAPAIGELFVGFDDQDFAVDDAVPAGHGCGAEIEFVADDGLEVVVQEAHCLISGPCVSARQIFSGGWGNSLSITSERVAGVVMGPSF